MFIPKRLQQIYRAEQERLENAAAAYVRSYINALASAAPEASVAMLREAAKDAIRDALNAFGDQAGALALELFDQIAEREGIAADSALCTNAISEDMMDAKVRYFAGKIARGDLPGFTKDVTDLTRFYVKRTAYENLVRNCERNDVRYARVPSGAETCAFCFMLSSRGFVYHNEVAARGDTPHGMHAHCDCIIVPGVPGKTRIAGYDPDVIYDRWKMCAETVGAPADDYRGKNVSRIMKEVETRDWRWLYSHDSEYSSEVSYLKSRDSLTDNEKKGIDHLSSKGFKLIVNHEDQKAAANIDLTINGDLWEMKNVGDGKHSIEDHLREARSKWKRLKLDSCMKVVVTTEGRSKDFSSAVEEVRRRLKCGEEALVVDQNGAILRIQK